jgi:hypothetical protein
VISGLALSEPLTVFLSADLLATQLSGSISVTYPAGSPNYGTPATGNFAPAGTVTIDKEMISYTGVTNNTFTGITRGCYGTPIEDHFNGNQLTNLAYFIKVKADTLVGETPAAWGVVRVDLTPPSAPTNVTPSTQKTHIPATQGVYELQWGVSTDYESGVFQYQIQERMDANPVWKTVDVVPGSRFSDNIGSGVAHDLNGNSISNNPRPQGHFYYYRIRAENNAGSWGAWSAISLPAETGVPTEVISSVSNYPNPVDTRRGGPESKTTIVYILNQNASVTITLYDLLGYQVFSWSFQPGENGGSMGANAVLWDGTNGSGFKVAKGGYIAQIKVQSEKGLVTAIRKIGVIH